MNMYLGLGSWVNMGPSRRLHKLHYVRQPTLSHKLWTKEAKRSSCTMCLILMLLVGFLRVSMDWCLLRWSLSCRGLSWWCSLSLGLPWHVGTNVNSDSLKQFVWIACGACLRNICRHALKDTAHITHQVVNQRLKRIVLVRLLLLLLLSKGILASIAFCLCSFIIWLSFWLLNQVQSLSVFLNYILDAVKEKHCIP